MPRWWQRRRAGTHNPASEQPKVRADNLATLRDRENRRRSALTNIPSYAGAAIVLLVVLKIAIVSRGAPSTMLTLIADAGPLQVLVGTLILLLPFSGIVVIYANDETYRRSGMSTIARNEVRLGVYLAIFVLSFLLPWSWVATVVALLIFRHLVFLRDKKKGRTSDRIKEVPLQEWLQTEPADVHLHELWSQIKEKISQKRTLQGNGVIDLARMAELQESIHQLQNESRTRADEIYKLNNSQGTALASVLASYAFALLIQFLANDKPWIPAEQLNLEGGDREIAYVVNSGDSWTTILREKERAVIRIPSDSIKSRKVCSIKRNEEATKTIWRFRQAKTEIYDKCPAPRHR